MPPGPESPAAPLRSHSPPQQVAPPRGQGPRRGSSGFANVFDRNATGQNLNRARATKLDAVDAQARPSNVGGPRTRRAEAHVAGLPDDVACLAPPWLRPDGPPISAAVPAAAAVASAQRLLVGWGVEGPQARLRVDPAGQVAELQLTQSGPKALVVTILTGGDRARETLVVALEHAARRLALRGIELRVERRASDGGSGPRDRETPREQRGRDDR